MPSDSDNGLRPCQKVGAMPRGIDLPIPFPSRISPDHPRAEAEHLNWPTRFGLITDEASAQRHVSGRYPELASRFNPSAVGPDLDLAVDLNSWFFLFDDVFDGPDGCDPRRAAELVRRITRVLDGPISETDEEWPFTRAFADLWMRSQVGMSASWRNRTALHWREYLDGYISEARNRCDGRVPTAIEHLRLRSDTIGVRPTLDTAERIGHYELPASLLASPELIDLCQTAIEVVVIHNDLCSLEKEEADGDIHNLVLILQHRHGWSRDQAVTASIAMIRDRADRFVRLETRLPTAYDRLNLTTTDQADGDRYLHDALRALMRGGYDWAENSGRYTVPSVAFADQAPQSTH